MSLCARRSDCAKAASSWGAGSGWPALERPAREPGTPWVLKFRDPPSTAVAPPPAWPGGPRPSGGTGSASAQDRAGEVLPESWDPCPCPRGWGQAMLDLK